MQRRCDRNRNRSKRRSIYCPVHNCYLDSVSKKYQLFADQAIQLQERGISRLGALMLVSTKTTVALEGEWLEAFWCLECQEKRWYHVRKHKQMYNLAIAPDKLWLQATGVMHPHGNPSVGEFTRNQARMARYQSVKESRFID
jgi:hypothetical protein